ncbi:ATPase, T2SS/T4P/T4SS family [Actinoplanes sp. NEAU-A12]|uniref:ATPase, T2SS/T4P/T4SS family n=1 Tax=Actinoplanes sandaracinus TaxID=3045177 RepID=A0ABT6WXA7_9ACTN|nr:ATPase, T2SS/T4P/T4SS family [Actinoplanes sandaracinus]MDI6104370.1 ATPase, T2SS/T4P/T4SS family [Actinoplanes sandaracinus]
MSYPFDPRRPGRNDFTPELAPDSSEIMVVRRIRREVAERLTRATRAHETATGAVMSAVEQQETTRRLITETLDVYATEEMNAGRPPLRPDAESRVARSVADMLLGAGGLQPLLNDERVEDINANGCDQVFVRYTDGSKVQVGPIADSDAEMVELIRRLAADAGRAETGGEGAEERRWDRAAPILRLQLPDGSRLQAVMSVTRRPSLSIRRHHYIKVTLADLQQLGTLNPALRAFFAATVRARLNTLAAGRTGAGKTTFLRALASEIPADERLVTIEDTYELALDADKALHPDVVPMQSRDANVEGQGAIDMSELFRSGLRMSPDRVIVGEIRGHEVIPMLNAMSQGNDGSLGTIHASSTAGVFKKLALYARQSPERLEPPTTNLLVAESVHLVVHLTLTDGGRRVVTSVREVVDADDRSIASNEIFRPGPDGRAVPGSPPSTALLTTLANAGFNPGLLDEARTAPGGGWSS